MEKKKGMKSQKRKFNTEVKRTRKENSYHETKILHSHHQWNHIQQVFQYLWVFWRLATWMCSGRTWRIYWFGATAHWTVTAAVTYAFQHADPFLKPRPNICTLRMLRIKIQFYKCMI